MVLKACSRSPPLPQLHHACVAAALCGGGSSSLLSTGSTRKVSPFLLLPFLSAWAMASVCIYICVRVCIVRKTIESLLSYHIVILSPSPHAPFQCFFQSTYVAVSHSHTTWSRREIIRHDKREKTSRRTYDTYVGIPLIQHTQLSPSLSQFSVL